MMMMMATDTYKRRESGTSSKVAKGKGGKFARDGDRSALMPEQQHKQTNTTHTKKTDFVVIKEDEY